MQDGITVSLLEVAAGGRQDSDLLGTVGEAGRGVVVGDGADVGVDRNECIRFHRDVRGGRDVGDDRGAGDLLGVGDDLAGVERQGGVLGSIIGDDTRRTRRIGETGQNDDSQDGDKQRDERRRVRIANSHGRVPPVCGFLLELLSSSSCRHSRRLVKLRKSHQM